MIHNNEVLNKVICIAEKFTGKHSGLEVYIIQNVFGKIIVYIDTPKKQLVAKVEEELKSAIDVWLNTCELIEENYFAKTEIELWKQDSIPVRERIWVFEKYITNVYWDAKKRKKDKCTLSGKQIGRAHV